MKAKEEMTMYHRQTSAPTHPRFEGGRGAAVREMLVSSTPRRSGRNEEVNKQLQMKADELDRLFAEHKHRRTVRGRDRGDKVKVEDGIRGEFYEKYTQKRDSKLREEYWGVKREQKVMKMKAMLESLDTSSAKLKAHSRPSTTIIRDRDRLLSNLCEEEEDDKQFSDSSSKSVNSKKPQPPPSRSKRSTSSLPAASRASTGRASTSSLNKAAIPRPSSAKAPAARGSGSNLSDSRKVDQSCTSTRSKGTSVAEKPTMSTLPPSRKYSASPLKPLTLPKREDQSGLRPFLIKKGSDHLRSGSGPGASTPRARARNSFSGFSGPATPDDPVSPTGSTASWNPVSTNSGRARKKWGNGPQATVATCSDQTSRKDAAAAAGKQAPAGILRLLHFGRKTRAAAAESGADSDWASAGAMEGHGHGHFSANSALDYQFPSYDGFSDGAFLLERAQARGISALTSPANYKLKEYQSQRGTSRSFFSLPSFRNRGGETKLGR